MIWSAGRIVDDRAVLVSAADRTFEHGLGLFETFRTWAGRAALLGRHLDRLRASAEALGLSMEGVVLPGADDVAALVEANELEGDALVRLTLTGGLAAKRGGMLWIRASALPAAIDDAGVRLKRPIVRPPDRWLAGHKTLNYWSNRRECERAAVEGCFDTLFTDIDGSVLESTRANFFMVVKGRLVTPPTDGRILPGVMRGYVIEGARGLGMEVCEEAIFELACDEVFLTNSVRGMIPVRAVGDELRWESPGPVTRLLARRVRESLENGLTPT